MTTLKTKLPNSFLDLLLNTVEGNEGSDLNFKLEACIKDSLSEIENAPVSNGRYLKLLRQQFHPVRDWEVIEINVDSKVGKRLELLVNKTLIKTKTRNAEECLLHYLAKMSKISKEDGTVKII